jgi:hypothetical protein
MGLIGGKLVVDLVVEELLSVFSCVLYGQLIPRDVCAAKAKGRRSIFWGAPKGPRPVSFVFLFFFIVSTYLFSVNDNKRDTNQRYSPSLLDVQQRLTYPHVWRTC